MSTTDAATPAASCAWRMRTEVGGKAASLGELLAEGVRVPDGVVLTVTAPQLPPTSVVPAGRWRR